MGAKQLVLLALSCLHTACGVTSSDTRVLEAQEQAAAILEAQGGPALAERTWAMAPCVGDTLPGVGKVCVVDAWDTTIACCDARNADGVWVLALEMVAVSYKEAGALVLRLDVAYPSDNDSPASNSARAY